MNLGHVGFLAESEREDLATTVERALARDYLVEERMTLSVRVKVNAEVVFETWALNEATVEKASRERMLEVVIEVDGRPLSSFGCDGVVMSTPTGSTAYSFSAGGPVVWPSLDAMLLVPLSAHALFARPLVVGPDSTFAVEVLDRAQGDRRAVVRRPPHPRPSRRSARHRSAVLGARAPGTAEPRPVHRPAGAQVQPSRARLAGPAQRGGAGGAASMIEEIVIRNLGVIGEAQLPLGTGFTAITGETGAGKTMVVTALGLLLGSRADSQVVRAGSGQADRRRPLAGRGGRDRRRPGARRRRRGGIVRFRRPRRNCCSPAPSLKRAAAGRPRADAPRRSACSPNWASTSWSCTASPTRSG